MGSDGTLRIPIVDLSDVNLKPGTDAWAAARAQVRAALDGYSCFEAACRGVVPDLRPEAAFGAAEELFALPLEAKRRNTSDKVYHGYLGQMPGLTFESLMVDDAMDPAAARTFTNLMWPQGNPTVCETIGKFVEKAAELDAMVRRMLLESLGVENHYDSHMGSTKYMMRFSEYAPSGAGPGGEAAKEVVLTPHVDGSMSTLINQDQVDGLEVQARSGDWVLVKPSSPNAFIYLIGDAFRAWSNDRLRGAPHRVRVGAGEKRHTLLLFAVPKDDVVVEAPAELVEEGRPPRFRPFRYSEYLEFLAAKKKEAAAAGGDGEISILTAFCGGATGGGEQLQ